MARILIAWELGEAWGHLGRCTLMAEGLRQRGHEVVLALKDVRLPNPAQSASFQVLAAPMTPMRRVTQRYPVNYAEILISCGFADAGDLAARLRAWQSVLTLTQADYVLGNHAPTALLAAHLHHLPYRTVGTGFSIPPDVSPWPSIRPRESVPAEALLSAERHLDAVTSAAQALLRPGQRAAEPVRVRDLFQSRVILDTLVELDHYGARSQASYVGPMLSLSHAQPVAWLGDRGPKVLAYLRPGVPGFTALLQALGRLDAEVLCVVPDFSPEQARRFATSRMRIALKPIELPPLLLQARVAVCYGGSGFVAQALLAGVPVLVQPRHVEQALLALRIEEQGLGKFLDPKADMQEALVLLNALLAHSACHQTAQDLQRRYSGLTTELAVKRVLDLVEQDMGVHAQ